MEIRQLKSDEAPLNDTVRHEFLLLEGAPWVELRQASRANRPYFNDLLKRMARLRKVMEKGEMSLDVIEKQ